jgi:hypothetical protein
MRLEWHVAASVLLGAGTMAVTHNFSIVNWLVFFLGGVGIDLVDHGLWGLVNVKPLTIANAKKVGWEKFDKMEPGFYFFHTIECFIICWLWLIRWHWGRYFMTAYGLHLFMDGVKYRYTWRNWEWLPAWSVVAALDRKLREN